MTNDPAAERKAEMRKEYDAQHNILPELDWFTWQIAWLFRADISSAVPDGGKDSERMDWLCERVINVRDPLPYGSRDMFWASPTDDDGGHEPSDLRAKIDAAIAKEKK